MKGKFEQYLVFVFLSVCFFPVTADPLFGDEEAGKDVIWKSGLNRYIVLREQDSDEYGANDHPVALENKAVKNALSALELPAEGFFADDEDTRPVFSVAQVNLLSVQLPKALRIAESDQDVVFVLEKSERKILALQDQRYITGRIFYKDERLNIILGEFDFFRSQAFESFYDGSGRDAVPYDFDFGDRTRDANVIGEALVNAPGIENKKIGTKPRYDWFVIDVDLAAQFYADKQKSKDPVPVQSKQLEREAARMARERRLMRAEMARLRKEMKNNGGSGGGGASAQSIEKRIETLDALLEKELITQEEYDTRRKEILNDI